MNRATVSQVQVILPSSSLLDCPQIQAAIDAANCVVDRAVLGCAGHLSDSCLTMMEVYLSAHLAAVSENTLSISQESDPCGGGKVTYGFKFGEGIKGTPFGQTANFISGGCLAEFDKQPVDLFSIGKIS